MMTPSTMSVTEAIHGRRSLPRLALPMPDEMVLETAFAAAGRAPDHRLLRPWRYLVLSGEALVRLGEAFHEGVRQTDPERAEREAAKLRQMPLRAPMIIVAILSLQDHPTVPDWEQWLSLGAGVQNLLLTLHASGFGAMWRTGDLAGNVVVRDFLGLAAHERVAGFIYTGTAAADKAAPAPAVGLWQHWSGR